MEVIGTLNGPSHIDIWFLKELSVERLTREQMVVHLWHFFRSAAIEEPLLAEEPLF